ncbi:MAG: 26S proteasome non-ATPase regulatory subunit [Cirrosporium novae-zelandiae]|nr:MAG: 26S proteasome non-ATPase regulatory subunit [Cirrosporium novae-zelandiae]KAI9736029.1 MAG: 26S proteasome non-ATPase regulatory subunit [Cirrosporium novae-zelandiae]
MPDGRNLRSNRSDASSSANGRNTRSGSKSSSSKDKPAPARTGPNNKKTTAGRKGTSSSSSNNMPGDKPQASGTDPVENGVNGTDDVEMKDEQSAKADQSAARDKDGDAEMTVVVPPPKGQKPSTSGQKKDIDSAMEGVETTDAEMADEAAIDPEEKVLSDIKHNFTLLERAVAQFDARFTLRVLRSVSSMRKHLTPDVIARAVVAPYSASSPVAKTLLAALGKEGMVFERGQSGTKMDIDDAKASSSSTPKSSQAPREPLPEIDTYLSILVQVHLYDSKAIQEGVKFSDHLVERLRTLNRRTLDALAAKVYFYYSLFYEQLAPFPPSPVASVISIRQPLLAALRTAVLRKDQDTQAAVTTLLLRNYLSTSHISQADLLISHTEFPPAASNNQIARYLYYLGRIRAIQLAYTEAHDQLTGATRKSPSTPSAGGFYQASTKLLVVVELLMGDIPERAIFRQPSLEHALQPYFRLVQVVSVGDLTGFEHIVQTHNAAFKRDGTYTLILRLRQNVIKTGIRMMSLSYARISLRDICLRLGLDSEESAEYIVAKAIRDGVIEAVLDHEKGFMKSKDVGDVYATREPGEAFHDRIRACLDLHDESVRAMRFPMNQHRLELKNAQEARERERELAKEIVEGEMDDDDAGGDFEGM